VREWTRRVTLKRAPPLSGSRLDLTVHPRDSTLMMHDESDLEIIVKSPDRSLQQEQIESSGSPRSRATGSVSGEIDPLVPVVSLSLGSWTARFIDENRTFRQSTGTNGPLQPCLPDTHERMMSAWQVLENACRIRAVNCKRVCPRC